MSWIATGVGVYLSISFCIGAVLGPLLRSKMASENDRTPGVFSSRPSWRDDPGV